MPLSSYDSSSRVVRGDLQGSVFPRSEKETVFSLIIDGASGEGPSRIRGSAYGRSVKAIGPSRIDGVVVSRGDVTLDATRGKLEFFGGITSGGNIVASAEASCAKDNLSRQLDGARMVIRGDVTAGKDIYLVDAIVLGSVRSANCKLERCIVLGTICAQEQLTIVRSAIAGYASRSVTFEGLCTMIHALGESATKPIFAAGETAGVVTPSAVKYYPAIRGAQGFMASEAEAPGDPDTSGDLVPETDWVLVRAGGSQALGQPNATRNQWVLSIGGRVADFTKIRSSIEALSALLKCGFEFEHYHPKRRSDLFARTASSLSEDEKWILSAVCPREGLA